MLTQTAVTNKRSFSNRKLFLVWSYASFLMTMNTTMFNVALPSVQADLTVNVSLASWIISGYSMVLAISTLTFSRLSEFIPIKKLLLLGVILVGLGSSIGFFSNQYLLVLLTRIVQAIGAGAIISLGVIFATRYVPITYRARALVMLASAAVLGLGLGPVIGGMIDQFLGWNFLFVITGTILLTIPFYLSYLPDEVSEKAKFDTMGSILSVCTVICLMLFLTTLHYAFIFLFILFITIAIRHLIQAEKPFVKVSLFKRIPFVQLLFISFLTYFVYFSMLFILPLSLNDLFLMNSSEIGLLVLPGAVVAVLLSNRIGFLLEKLGNSQVTFIGQVLFITAGIVFIFSMQSSPYYVILAFLLLNPAFTALATSTRDEAAVLLPAAEVSTGVGVVQLFQFLGGATGVTLSGSLLNLQSHLLPTLMYRNVLIIFIVCTCISIGLLLFYRHHERVLKTK